MKFDIDKCTFCDEKTIPHPDIYPTFNIARQCPECKAGYLFDAFRRLISYQFIIDYKSNRHKLIYCLNEGTYLRSYPGRILIAKLSEEALTPKDIMHKFTTILTFS